MSKLPEWSDAAKIMIARIELKALARIERTIETGKDADARPLIKMILDRSMPEPKIDSSARSLQFITPADTSKTAELMEKMKRRAALPAPAPAPEPETETEDHTDDSSEDE